MKEGATIPAGNSRKAIPDANANLLFYEAFASFYEQLYACVDVPETVRQWLMLLRDNGIVPCEGTAQRNPKRLLDLGCGPGWHLVAWAKAGFAVSGLDASSAMLGLAARRLKETFPDIPCPFYQADIRSITDLNGVRERFDLAVSHLNFPNLFPPSELKDVFKGVAGMVNPNGHWVVDCSIPKEAPLDVFEMHCDGSGSKISHIGQYEAEHGHYKQRWIGRGLDCTEYYWFHTRKKYESVAEAAGWKVAGWFEWRPGNPDAPWISATSFSERLVIILRRLNVPSRVATAQELSHGEDAISEGALSKVEDIKV